MSVKPYVPCQVAHRQHPPRFREQIGVARQCDHRVPDELGRLGPAQIEVIKTLVPTAGPTRLIFEAIRDE